MDQEQVFIFLFAPVEATENQIVVRVASPP